MLSTVEDLARFATALNRGRLITNDTRAEMLRKQTSVPTYQRDGPPVTETYDQGYVWRMRADEAGRRYAYMCGAVKAFAVCVVDYVDDDLVAVFGANGDAGGFRITAALANAMRP